MSTAAIVGIVLSGLLGYLIVAGATFALLPGPGDVLDSEERAVIAGCWPLSLVAWIGWRAFRLSFSAGESTVSYARRRRASRRLPKAQVKRG